MNSLMNKKIGTYGHDLYKNMVGNIYTRQCYISPTIKEIWSALNFEFADYWILHVHDDHCV